MHSKIYNLFVELLSVTFKNVFNVNWVTFIIVRFYSLYAVFDGLSSNRRAYAVSMCITSIWECYLSVLVRISTCISTKTILCNK